MLHTDLVERSTGMIRYARSGSDDVAWTEHGAGPPVLIGGWWMSHLEHDWKYPPIREFVEAIARHRRVIRLDTPGSGLSHSRRETPPELAPHVDAMTAVLDAAGVDRATVLAGSSGCPIAISFAARHPERVERLVLAGSYLAGDSIAAAADRTALVELVRRSWGVSARVMAGIFFPNATADEQRAYLQHQRMTASSDAAAAALAAVYSFDARKDAGGVRAPTLALHRRGDRAIRLALGAETAAAIPGAALQVLDGTAHHPWHGDSAAFLDRALGFIGVPPGDRSALTAPALPSLTAAEDRDGTRISARERQILLLVAEGRTDAEIAAQLFLSVHTVHRHVANARAKLSVPSRAAAAAWVAAHPG